MLAFGHTSAMQRYLYASAALSLLTLWGCGEDPADSDTTPTSSAPTASAPTMADGVESDACMLLEPSDWEAVMAIAGVTEDGLETNADGSTCRYSLDAEPLGNVRIISPPDQFHTVRDETSETISGILNDAYWHPSNSLVAVLGDTRMFFVQMDLAAVEARTSAEALARLAAPKL
jgi:hypothetical protein